MARIVRMTLDGALFSMRIAKPTIVKAWSIAKNGLENTKAQPIVKNHLVAKIETGLDNITNLVERQIEGLVAQLLPIEEKYLERQLEIVRKKMGKGMCKALRPGVATSWEYAKTEIVPPFTQAFFKGPGGRALEATCGGFADTAIGIMQKTIQGIDEAEAKKIAQKAAQEKAKLDKIKAEAEAKRKQAESAAKAKAAEEAKKPAAKVPEPKKAEEKKAEAKKPEAKKPEAKKAKAVKPAPKKPEPKKK